MRKVLSTAMLSAFLAVAAANEGGICDSSPLIAGDVWLIEVEKGGFIGGLEGIVELLSEEDQAKLGSDGVIPVATLQAILEDLSEQEDLDEEGRAAVEELLNEFTSTQGQIVCDTYDSQPSPYARWYYPFNESGWVYEVFSECDDVEGWRSHGGDVDGDTIIKYYDGDTAVAELRDIAHDEEFVALTLRLRSIGNLGEEVVQACCFPATEEERNCTAVVEAVENASGETPTKPPGTTTTSTATTEASTTTTVAAATTTEVETTTAPATTTVVPETTTVDLETTTGSDVTTTTEVNTTTTTTVSPNS